MIIKLEDSNQSHEKAPAGSHVARCYQLIDLGTHTEEYQGESKRGRKVLVGWELCEEFLTQGKYAGQPFHVSKTAKLSLHEKSGLRAMLKSWRGRDFTEEELNGFDLRNILNAYCLLNLVENEKGYTNVGTVTPLHKSMVKPAPVTEVVYFSLDAFDKEVFEKLPKWIKEKIQASEEYLLLEQDGVVDVAPALINQSSGYDPEIGF